MSKIMFVHSLITVEFANAILEQVHQVVDEHVVLLIDFLSWEAPVNRHY